MSPLLVLRSRRGLALLAAMLCAAPALSQPEALAEKGFIRSRVFPMPFDLRPADKTNVQQIKLFVKSEQGGEWALHATGSPAQMRYDAQRGLDVGSFDVRLDRDGTYAFAVMTVMANNTSVPKSVDDLRPDRTVVVDTTPPKIVLEALPVRPRGDGSSIVGLKWRVEDANLAKNSIRLEGRWFGQVAWANFMRGTGPEEDGQQEWTLRQGQRMEVRLVAADRAGNQATRSIILGNGVGNTTGNSGGAGPDGGPIIQQPNYRLINTKTVTLSYSVRKRPPSGLKEIELWYTRLGADWKKLEQSFPAPDENSDTAEVTFDAPEDGAYGFIMIARSHAGNASQPPPKAHDTPQIWVEVDTKPPDATLKTVRLSQPGDARTLVLEWEAKDKNIEALPILFEYAEVDSKGNAGKWQELTTPLPNSGRYVCATPQLSAGCYMFRVRMHVFDKAGNITTKEWDKPISADVEKPQIEITDVKAPQRGAQPPKQEPPPQPPAPSPMPPAGGPMAPLTPPM